MQLIVVQKHKIPVNRSEKRKKSEDDRNEW